MRNFPNPPEPKKISDLYDKTLKDPVKYEKALEIMSKEKEDYRLE